MRFRGKGTDPRTGRTSVEELLKGRIGPEIYPKLADVISQGADIEALENKLNGVIDSGAEAVAVTLRHTAPRMLREHRKIDKRFRHDVRYVWGTALDLMYQVYVCAEELGSDLMQVGQVTSWDTVSEALYRLHSRACMVIREVHLLLTAGLPMAAHARARALYETAVIAALIAKYGRDGAAEGLAEGFLDHWIIDVVRDYEAAVEAGLNVDSAELAELKAQRDAAVTQYGGPVFGRDYGWAAPLFPDLDRKKGRINFVQLEKLADSGLTRLDYRLQSHHVHASALTLELHSYDRAGAASRLTGPTNTGLAEPAVAALDALVVATTALVNGASPSASDPMDLVFFGAITRLAGQAIAAFNEGDVEGRRLMEDWATVEKKYRRTSGPRIGRIRRVRRWWTRR